jgi:imidazolonepropionase-like amidohydrolase
MGYRYALSGTWKPTEEEKRLADPEILNAMADLAKIPPDKVPERVAGLVAKPPTPKVSDIALANLRRVWDAGIPVAMGTDAGNIGTLHGPSVFREMALMSQAGLTPLQVLRSATVNGARAFGREGDLGLIESGRLADLVILDGDPAADVANLATAWRVMKDGRIYDPQELMRSIGRR